MDTPHPNPAAEPGAPPPSAPSKLTIPAAVLQFFIFPLAVVVVCVLGYLFFAWLTYESRGPRELLAAATDAGTGKESRLLAAAEFARLLERHVQEAHRGRREPDAPLSLPPKIQALADPALAAFRAPPRDDSRDLMQAYLATALGLFRHRPAVPALLEALDGAAPQLKVPLLGALGAIADPEATPALLSALSDTDSGVRLQAAYALGLLSDRRAVAPLQARLHDPIPAVRWNAALALVRFADDSDARASARPVLDAMLDRAHVREAVARAQRQRDLTAWAQLWEKMALSDEDLVAYAMVKAMNAVIRLRDRSFEARLETIGAGDENMKVRECAMRTLEELRRAQ